MPPADTSLEERSQTSASGLSLDTPSFLQTQPNAQSPLQLTAPQPQQPALTVMQSTPAQPSVRVSTAELPTRSTSKLSLFSANKLAVRTTLVALGVMLIVATGAVVANLTGKHATEQGPKYGISNLQLQGVKDLNLTQANELAVNGELQANQGLVITPSSQPSAPVTGQIYYDQKTKAPYYYNGSQFVSLAPIAGVTSLHGATGAIDIGNGLTLVNNKLSVDSSLLNQTGGSGTTTNVTNQIGVSSLQGLTGDLTLSGGGGIGISGTTITNTGVTSLGGAGGAISLGSGLNLVSGSIVNSGVLSLAGTPNEVIVGGTGGNLNLSLPQAIAITSNPTFGGLTLGAAGNQETLLAGNTGGNLTFTLPAGDGSGGDCIVTDGSGHLSFSTCLSGGGGGGSGVTSLNGQSGTVSVANATGSGGIVTIHNAVADGTTKGIAAFNLNDFTDNGSGVISLHTTAVTPGGYGDASHVATFTVNATGQVTAASSTPIAISGAAITSGTVGDSFLSSNVAKYNAVTANFTGALQQGGNNVCTTAGNCVGTGGNGGIGGGGNAGTIPIFTGSGFTVGNSVLTQASGNLTASGTLTVQGNSVTVGVAGTTAGTLVLASPSAGGSVVLATAPSGQTASGTAQFPAFAGTDIVCLQTAGNCSGVNGGSGNTSYIFNQTTQQTSANINIQARSASVAVTVQGAAGQDITDLVTSGGQTAAKFSSTGGLTLGNASAGSLAGQLTFADGTNDGFTSTLQSATLSHSINISLPYSTGNAGNFQDVVCLQFASNCTGGITGSGANGQVAYFTGAGTVASSSLLSFNSLNGNLTFGASSVLGASTNSANNTTGYTLTLQGGDETGTTSIGGGVNIDAGTGTGTNGSVNIGAANAASVNIGNTSKTTAVAVKTNGSSTNAFTVQNASGSSVLSVDTVNMKVSVNTPANYTVSAATVTFAAKVDYTVGTGPLTVATGDFNSDGFQDVAAVNKNSNTISVLMNNGNGTFATKVDYSTNLSPNTVAVGDFNGDGRPDIAVTNWGNSGTGTTVSVFINSGGGVFAAKVDYTTLSGPTGIAVADFNSDGKLDLVVGDNSTSFVSVLLGNGNGTFATKVDYSAGTGATGVAVGDFNGDSKMDIAAADNGGGAVAVLLNNGNGTFAGPATYTTSSGPLAVVVADFNSDGKSDLAVTNQGISGTNTLMSVLLNNGNGTFGTATNYTTIAGPNGMATADFNGDGKPDLVENSNNSGAGTATSVFINNGDGTFGARTDYTVGTGPAGVAAADFNGDGKQDLVVDDNGSSGGTTVSVLLNSSGSTSVGAALSVAPTSAATGGLIIQGASSQSANLLVVQNASGNIYLKVDGSGNITSSGTLRVTSNITAGTGTSLVGNITVPHTTDVGDIGVVLGANINAVSSTNEVVLRGIYAATTNNLTGGGQIGEQRTLDVINSTKTGTSTNQIEGIFIENALSQGTVNNGFGLDVAQLQGTNQVGVVINSLTGSNNTYLLLGTTTPPSGSYGIYESTAIKNYFAGNLLLGNTTGTNLLSVGSASQLTVDSSGNETIGGGATLTVTGNGSSTADLIDLGSNIPANGQNLLVYHSSNFRTGLGIQTNVFRIFTSAGAITSFGHVSTANGSTYTEDAQIDTNGNLEVGTSAAATGRAMIQAAAGQDILDLMTSGAVTAAKFNSTGQLTLGSASSGSVAGKLNLADGTNDGFLTSINTAVQANNVALSIPADTHTTDTFCLQSAANCGIVANGTVNQVAYFSAANTVSSSSLIYMDVSNNRVDVGTHVASGGTLNLAGQTTSAVGVNPWGVAGADLNGDGRPDIITANFNSDTISVLMNNGNGTFAGQVTYATSGSPEELAAADLNGDGHPDIVVGNATSTLISVLMNNGNGTFAGQVNYNTGSWASVAIADVNNDGHPDLVGTKHNTNNVGVLINNGNGTFAAQVTYATGGSGFVKAADLNGDGFPDIAVANESANTVSVLLNNGNGTFAAKQDFAVGTTPEELALSDVNGDGRLDIMTVNSGSNNVSVLMNNGTGTFATQVTYGTGTVPQSIAAADMNGDSHPDVVVSNKAGNTVSVLKNNGNGTFAAKQDFGVGSGPVGVATADLNSDGYPDIMAANFSSNTASVLLNTTGGTPPIPSTLSVTTTSATEGGLYVQGAAGQTANLLVLQNASAKQLLSVNPFGNLTLGNASTGSLAGKLSLADGSNDGFLVSIATAVQGNNVSLSIPTDTNTTDTFCLQTKANCSGGVGGIGGSGTINQVAYFTGSGTVSSSALLSMDTTNNILTVTSANATALRVMNGGTIEFVVDAANGRVGINTGAIAPGANLTVNGTNNINLSWPDGLVGTPVRQTVNASGTSYTVPAGKTLYITSVMGDGTSGDVLVDGSSNQYYIGSADSDSLSSPVQVATGTTLTASANTISFTGVLINSGVTPVVQTVDTSGSTYTVPVGKTLYITSLYANNGVNTQLIDGSANVYYICNGTTGCGHTGTVTSFSLNTPIAITAGTVLKSSTGTLNLTGYLTNSNGYGGP